MIGFLSGSLHSSIENTIVINVGGVGYELMISSRAAQHLPLKGANVSFEVHTQSGENGIFLFGFLTANEKKLFQKLISVSGIGPKTAMGILSDSDPNEIIRAITLGDTAILTRFNGIGKKTAERLVLELKDKLTGFDASISGFAANDNPVNTPITQDVLQALISLGYAEFIAKKIVSGLEVAENDSVQSLLKKALAGLQRS